MFISIEVLHAQVQLEEFSLFFFQLSIFFRQMSNLGFNFELD